MEITHEKVMNLYFQTVKKNESLDENDFQPLPSVVHTETLHQTFSEKFQQFSVVATSEFFFFHWTDVSKTAASAGKLFHTKMDELGLEIVKSQILISYANDDNSWNLMDVDKYQQLKNVVLKINFLYVSWNLMDIDKYLLLKKHYSED